LFPIVSFTIARLEAWARRMRNRKLVVLKFGGTSMGNADSIRRVMEIIEGQCSERPVITVVSAMAGVTDWLLAVGADSLQRNPRKVDSALAALAELHESTFCALTDSEQSRAWIRRFVASQFGDVRAITHGILLLREFSLRTRDKLVSYGEILSSRLLARVLQDRSPKFCHSDARNWVVADPNGGGAVLDYPETEKRTRAQVLPLLDAGSSPVVAGFISRDSGGEPATLGRNGSDYSASIVGAALRASEIWIYTDVDGIMTADPNLVSEARVLPQISYQEAAEMSYFGAKVLHPKTMIPAVTHRIPIRIKNTFNPAAEGTLITNRTVRSPSVKTVTSVRKLALLNVQGNGMIGIPGVSSRVLDVLARDGISVMMISQSSSEHSICMVIQAADAERGRLALQSEFRLEIERGQIDDIQLTNGVSIVSIIGAGMRGTPGTSGKFFEALGKCRVNVLAIAQGASELNISAAILEKDDRHAVQAIHTAFGLTRELNVFVFGCGNIGRTLLKQIHDSRQHLARSLKVNLKVLGVSNSKTLCFSAAGLSNAELEALGSGTPMESLPSCEPRPESKEIFERIAGTYRSDVVVVDATGAELADTHIDGMRYGFHVVTANKKPLTTSLTQYQEMRRLCRRKGLNYQFEATFGAGLPLLSTLQDLVNTGDRILRIQGCLSGTLGFICSRIDEGVPFSKAVMEASSLGFTEPDPRDDLSGRDVARKALIIARELGIFLEMEQVKLRAMLPARFFRMGSIAKFLEHLPSADALVAQEASSAAAQGRVLRYMTDIGEQGCEVGLKQVPRDSPIGRLKGPDNILVFQTQRYNKHPLVIQGPGAGAGVTAAGVLSDILKIAKWV
jgi:bifunctional aspartokinase / homoserine dehydrogenase 1